MTNERQKRIEEQAAQIYDQIKANHPADWYRICHLINLFSMQDRFQHAPGGLDPEGARVHQKSGR